MATDHRNDVPVESIIESVRIALAEDVGSGDLTAGLVSAGTYHAHHHWLSVSVRGSAR